MRASLLPLAVAALTACASDECTSAPPCGARVEVACTAASTPVPVPASAEGCAFASAPTSLPVGSADVQLRTDDGETCSMRVTVTDRDAPTLDCAAVSVALRNERGAAVEPPSPRATDRCAERVTITSEPATLTGHGPVEVRYTATDLGGNRASCTATVDVRNAFAPSGLRVAHAALTGDRTAVTLVWDHLPDSDATAYRVERATSAAGPWTEAAVVAPDAPRHVEPELADAQTFYRVVTVLGDRDGAASAPVRALSIASAEYDLGVQPVPELSLPANAAARTPATTSAPMHAVVRHPADLSRGPFPLVLLLHGNHGNCRLGSYDRAGIDPRRDDVCLITNTGDCRTGTPTPNAEGLTYLAETLASHGYVVASVDANAINCRDGARTARDSGFITQRARLLVEHMRRWRAWNSAGGAEPFGDTFAGRVDLSRVGLLGHSRGAEAVAMLPATLASATDVEGLAVGSVFSLAPTNFNNPQPGAVPFATLVPVCDGDVFTYDGVQLYDRTLRNEGDAAPAAQIFTRHTNHNFFNTEWRFDDNSWGVQSCSPGEVDDPEMQPRLLEATVAAWFDGTLPAGAALEPWLRASGDVPPVVEIYTAARDPLDLRRSYASPRVARIDDFADGDLTRNLLEGALDASGTFAAMTPRACTGVSTAACDRGYTVTFQSVPTRFGWPHHNPFGPTPNRAAMALDWRADDAAFALDLGPGDGVFDASGYRVLSLRVASRANALNPDDRPSQDFEVAIVDADGRRASARVSEVTTVPHLYPSVYPRAVLQTARFTLAGLAARGESPLDLRRLRRVEVAMSVDGFAEGSLLVSDVEFAE